MKEPKWTTFNSATRSSVWKTLWISPLWLTWTLIVLLRNLVLNICLAFLNFWHWKNQPLLPAHILSEICKLLENFNLFYSFLGFILHYFIIIFIILFFIMLFIILYCNFLLLNLMMTFSFFLSWWHASRSLGEASFPVKDSTLQTSPNSLVNICSRTGEVSVIFLLKYLALFRDGCSVISLHNNELQVLEICNSRKAQ